MDLIVLESPSKVRDVEKYAKAAGFPCLATATVGHLFDLPPMAAGAAIDTRTFALDQLQPRDGAAAERVSRLRAAIAKADRVIVATDPDREGEAIAAEIWPWIPVSKAWRATFEEITPAGVERGLRAMRPELNTAAVEAAHTRRVIDRLAGWHGTDLVFRKLRQHRGISAGRLQSAALRLVVERHKEHQDFRPTSSFGVRVRLRTPSGAELAARLAGADGSLLTYRSRADAEAVPVPRTLAVAEVEAVKKSERPRPPFEASSWLQVACKALRVTVRDATQATQALFEAGLTTYPRTDTVRVADDAITWARLELERRFGPAYVPPVAWDHKDRGANTVQGAHEAIRPTLPHDPAEELPKRREGPWGKAYSLIECRFLGSQAAARIVEQTTARLKSEDELVFFARGHVEIFDGWRRVLATDAEEESEQPPPTSQPRLEDEDDGSLPALAAGDRLEVISAEITTHTTKPKPLFTQASLVAELKRLGIGRPSTYNSVVPLLLGRGWVTEEAPPNSGRKTKSEHLPVLVPAQVGVDLSAFLREAFPGLVDYAFTATMEAALDEIASGGRGRVEVAGAWWTRFERELSAAQTLKPRLPERKDLGPCPKCSAVGGAGHLRLIEGINQQTQKPYAFAACDADTKEIKVCGTTAQVHDGELVLATACPRCAAALRAINRKHGGHSWHCETDGWFLADRRWRLVSPPTCPNCRSPMVHRERSDPKGEFFWACFADKVFLDSDKFGKAEQKKTRRTKV
jgi:DNA topoisomerase-1